MSDAIALRPHGLLSVHAPARRSARLPGAGLRFRAVLAARPMQSPAHMRTMLIQLALASAGIAVVASTGCIKTDDDCAVAPAEAGDSRVLAPGGPTTATVQTPAAAKDCHATFDVVASFTGDDLYDPDLPQPQLIASANAVGVLGEQPGLVGIFDSWTQEVDPDSGEVLWSATLSAGAKNIDATAVRYGIFVDLAPGETRPVQVDLGITYSLPPAE